MQAKKHNGGFRDAELEVDHELPPAEDESSSPGSATSAPEPAADTEVERLRAERAAYLDRTARIQA